MNRLLMKVPYTVPIDGADFEINTDFRDCLFTIEKLQNPYFTPEEKLHILIYNMYLDDPPNMEEALEKALWFLRCGENRGKESGQPALCDFSHDNTYIYNAFGKAGINLGELDTMHWWTFMSRFAELPESMFSRIVYLRSKQRREKLSKEEKRECERIGWDVINLKTAGEQPRDEAFEEFLLG